MTKRDKQIVKKALAALHQYWKVLGYSEYGDGVPGCDDGCDGCIDCDFGMAWDAWEESEKRLREVMA